MKYAIWAKIEENWKHIVTVNSITERENMLLSLGKYETEIR